MAFNKGYSFIASASTADFNNYIYTEVYAGADATPTINGVVVTMAAGTSIEIKVKSISATPNVYLLGEKINVANGSSNIGGSF